MIFAFCFPVRETDSYRPVAKNRNNLTVRRVSHNLAPETITHTTFSTGVGGFDTGPGAVGVEFAAGDNPVHAVN
jgi:hypothetical protein